MYKVDMKLRRLKSKKKVHHEVQRDEMTFTEMMRLITQRPIIDHRAESHSHVPQVKPS